MRDHLKDRTPRFGLVSSAADTIRGKGSLTKTQHFTVLVGNLVKCFYPLI